MEKYRRFNIKLTPQRIAIFDYLEGNKNHPSAEDIYKAVKKQFSTMSFATVYNTLEALREKGNVRELKIDEHKKRYDPDMSPHHHVICTKCNVIHDVFSDIGVHLPDEVSKGFDISGKSIEFFGVCRKCKY
ncbi:MAG: transcriptional repressor [Nitrospiraceae bacterium]|nr:MAG: transcriptional repressor [Nitrospiraceae bacterium]